uniref:Uncharacterized protein n=1 Tax=Equus asinus TaxID=9793 RepID=A0A8C4M7K9_EQUAS
MGDSQKAQVAPMGLLSPQLSIGPASQPMVPCSSSEHLQHFLQCDSCFSHSLRQCTMTFRPPRQGFSSLVVLPMCLMCPSPRPIIFACH